MLILDVSLIDVGSLLTGIALFFFYIIAGTVHHPLKEMACFFRGFLNK